MQHQFFKIILRTTFCLSCMFLPLFGNDACSKVSGIEDSVELVFHNVISLNTRIDSLQSAGVTKELNKVKEEQYKYEAKFMSKTLTICKERLLLKTIPHSQSVFLGFCIPTELMVQRNCMKSL